MSKIQILRAGQRGHTDAGWLDSHHSFSFGEYHNPAQMGFRALRVINDDRVAAGMGFGTHGHRDMEILSFVLEGELAHKDSLGTGSVIRPGDVQRMTAGTGVRHSEFNASKSDKVRFLQIWILPEKTGLAPGYEQKTFAAGDRADRLRLLASRDGREGSVTIHQDVSIHGAVLKNGARVSLPIAEGRAAWVQVARGSVVVNGNALAEGDGLALSPPAGDGAQVKGETIDIVGAGADSEVLVFDLA